MRSQAILVFEDEAAVAVELGRLLQGFGYRVLGPAFTVRQALEMIEAEPPDAALLDLNVGGERVTADAEALKARNVPFGLVTASADVREPELKSAPMVRKPISNGDESAHLLQSVRPATERVSAAGARREFPLWWSAPLGAGQVGSSGIDRGVGFRKKTHWARQHRSHSVAFKRQGAEEFLAGETLHGLAKRHAAI